MTNEQIIKQLQAEIAWCMANQEFIQAKQFQHDIDCIIAVENAVQLDAWVKLTNN